MSKGTFVTVGHISNDLLPNPHLNGTVVNAALTAKHMGFEAHLITKMPKNHPYLHELIKLGIKITNLPIKNKLYSKYVTSFKNVFYDTRRVQLVTEIQEPISDSDLQYFPDIPEKSIVLFAPLINELSYEVIKKLSRNNYSALTAQGYLREADSKGVVHKKSNLDLNILSDVNAVIVSDEDISFSGDSIDRNYLNQLISKSKILVLTKNKNGSEIYIHNKSINISAFQIKEDKYDYSGAGDVFTASFLLHVQSYSTRESASFASLYSAMKIIKSADNIGINTIPSKLELKRYIQTNESEIISFSKLNKISPRFFFDCL